MSLDKPRPNAIKDVLKCDLGGAHRKFILIDDTDERWLFKPQAIRRTAIDVAAATTMTEA